MSEGEYTAVPRNEDEKDQEHLERSRVCTGYSLIWSALGLFGLAVLFFGLGFGVGWEWALYGACPNPSHRLSRIKMGYYLRRALFLKFSFEWIRNKLLDNKSQTPRFQDVTYSVQRHVSPTKRTVRRFLIKLSPWP